MTSILQRVLDRFAPIRPLQSGTYHFQSPPETKPPYRLHLRLEPDGEGILIVNASTILHLNQTAAEYAYHLIQQTPVDQVAATIAGRYKIGRDQAAKDYQDITDRIQTLITTPDLDPVTFLDFERRDPYATKLSAPLRLDCALTYRVSEGAEQNVAPTDRVRRELLSEEWFTVFDKAWQAGVPHIVLTGGAPTLRPDLPELIAHCEATGQVTGLLTDGLRLSETDYLHKLLESGLDHLMIVLQPNKDQCWEAIRDAVAEDIALTVHLTLSEQNKNKAASYVERLAGIGVTKLSLSASHPSLGAALQILRRTAAEKQIDLVWDIPVPYSAINPIALEMDEESLPTGAGQAWLYVEPDGDVLAAQGARQVLGNLLTDDWDKIWKNH